MNTALLSEARRLSRDAFRNAALQHYSAAILTNDTAKAGTHSRVGAHLTARQMALKPHRLNRDGMEARAEDGGRWLWSNHFNVWACVAVEEGR
jgi:hypothetical protein